MESLSINESKLECIAAERWRIGKMKEPELMLLIFGDFSSVRT
jgi:hypothetical protein